MPVLDVEINPEGAVRGARTARDAIGDVAEAANALGVSMGRLGDNRIRNAISGVVKTLGTLFAMRKTWAMAEGFLDAAAQAETYRQRLRAVVGEIREADELYDRIAHWAALNPVDTDDAIAAFVRLKSAAVQNSEDALHAIADLAAVVGASMTDVAGAIVSTEVEPLRRMGILLDRTGKQAVIQSGNVRVAVEKDINSIRQGLIDVAKANYFGAMLAQAGTWSGLMDTMRGLWSEFQKDVMGAAGSGGPFDAIKRMISRINDEWVKWTESQDYKAFLADVQRSTTRALEQLTRFGESLGAAFRVALEHIDKVIAGCEALIVMFTSRGLLAMLGFVGGVPAAIATITGAAVGLSAAFPPATDAASRLKNEISRVEGQVEALRQAAAQSVVLGITVDDLELQEAASRLAMLRAELYDVQKAQSQGLFGKAHVPVAPGVTKPKVDALEAGAVVGGPSAAERLVASMRDKMRYLGADGKAFLQVLDSWAAKLKPLSEDWKKIADMQREIREESSKRVGEETAAAMERAAKAKAEMDAARDAARQGVEQFWSNLSWENSQGLLPDAKYLDMLKSSFSSLSADLERVGLDMQNAFNWTPEMKDRFSEIQSIAERLSQTSMESLAGQFESGTISADQYRGALEALLGKFQEYPLVVQSVRAELAALDTTLAGTTKSIQTLALEAERSLKTELAEVPASLADAFSSAIVNSENLGDALRNLAKEIAALALRAMFLKTLGGIFGGVFGGGGPVGGMISGGGVVGGVFGAPVAAPAVSPDWVPRSAAVARSSGGPAATSADGQRGAQNITVNIRAIDSQSFAQAMRGNKAVVESLVVENIMSSGMVRRAIQGAG